MAHSPLVSSTSVGAEFRARAYEREAVPVVS